MVKSDKFSFNSWNICVWVVQFLIAHFLSNAIMGPSHSFFSWSNLVFFIIFVVLEIIVRMNYLYRSDE